MKQHLALIIRPHWHTPPPLPATWSTTSSGPRSITRQTGYDNIIQSSTMFRLCPPVDFFQISQDFSEDGSVNDMQCPLCPALLVVRLCLLAVRIIVPQPPHNTWANQFHLAEVLVGPHKTYQPGVIQRFRPWVVFSAGVLRNCSNTTEHHVFSWLIFSNEILTSRIIVASELHNITSQLSVSETFIKPYL